MRFTGRAPDALRPVRIERHFINTSAGSALISFGNTRVLCTANFEMRLPPWLRDAGKGWVTAEYAMLPGSSPERVSREAAKKGRSQEISRLIGRSLRSVVDLAGLGECQVLIDCDVLQADGGTRTAAITGAFVALHDALQKSVQAGNLARVPVFGPCAAVSVGIVDGEALLDLDYAEDVKAEVDMNIVMNSDGRLIEVQGTAETGSYTRKQLDQMLDLGSRGIEQLIALQREVLGIE
ncbi:MAG: ribonuclease PH [Candidatus Hydrogenedentes bacterium]|nr:ribonuclease PH [Candidatus Hydrogenedentota bacterium]